MTSQPPEEGRRVLVRLSDVPLPLRITVAEEVVRRGKLRGLEALTMMMAAQAPSRATMLYVPAPKAERVLREGRRPLGATPAVWSW
jgi:hypothetical protein